MNCLVFGGGSIFREFYLPILTRIGANIDLVDPRLGRDEFSNGKIYQLVLVLSPPQMHLENLIRLFKGDSKYDKIIIEKPALVSLRDYTKLIDECGNPDTIERIYTVTPRRLSTAWQVLNAFGPNVAKVNIQYGTHSKWTLHGASHPIFNSCLFDLGPHVIDMLSSSLEEVRTVTPKILHFQSGYNSFDSKFQCGFHTLSISVNRSAYKPNLAIIHLADGSRVLAPLDVNNVVYASFPLQLPPLNVTSALNETLSVLRGGRSHLFSPLSEYLPTLKIIESLYG